MHAIKWTIIHGINRGILRHMPSVSKVEVEGMAYEKKVKLLVGEFSPKELLCIFIFLCVEKNINIREVDMVDNFLAKERRLRHLLRRV